MAGPFGEVGGEAEMWGEPTYLWEAIICSTRRNHFSKVNNKPHYRLEGEKNSQVGGAWGWLKSRQRPEGVSLRLKQGWCVSHQSGCIHMSQELVICSICVCITSTSSSRNNNNNVEHTPHNVDVAWWVSGDKTGRGAKFAQACNFFFLQEQQKKHEGKTEKRMRNKNRKWSCCQRRWWRWWDETVCHRMAEQVLQRRQRQIQL